MAKVVNTLSADVVHTIEVSERELSMITSLLGQCRHGETTAMYNTFLRALTAPRVMLRNRGNIPALDFQN